MQLLAHLTKEASDAIGVAVALLLVAAIVVITFVVWAVAAVVRHFCKSKDRTSDSMQEEE